MRITSIISNPRNTDGVQFKGGKYQEIKFLPKLSCACCGKKMISSKDYYKAFSVIAKPLSKIINGKAFSYWAKQPSIWAILQDFAAKYPKFSLDKIMSDKENRVILKKALKSMAYENEAVLQCNNDIEKEKMVDKIILDDYGDILNRSRSVLKGSSVVMKRMTPFKKCLDGEKLATFEQLEIYAQKYPRKTLSEIINMDEIYKFHKTKDLLQRAETREKLDFHFNNIEKLIKKVDPESEDMIFDLKKEVESLFDICGDVSRRIYEAKQIYKQALAKYKDKNLEKKVMAEIEQLPTTFITKDSFLVYAKNHNYGDARIISSLLVPSEVSFEHILPKRHQGKDFSGNGIVLCRDCNRKRGATPYEEFVQYHPRMPYYTQKQVRMIANYILEGRMPDDFRLWPIQVAKTLNENSNGIINPDVSNYVRKALQKSNEKLEMNTNIMQDIKNERNEKFTIIEELQKKIEEINDNIVNLEEQEKNIQKQNNSEQHLNKTLSDYLNE